jgi:hypothetical protein
MHVGQTRNLYNIWLENVNVRDHSEDIGIEGRMILQRSYRNRVRRYE